jgi:hypothetical protein
MVRQGIARRGFFDRLSTAHCPLPTALWQWGQRAGGINFRTGLPPQAGQRETVFARERLQPAHFRLTFVGTVFPQ